MTRENWDTERHPFHADHGLVLLSSDRGFVGELIYKRLDAGRRRVIYVSGTDMDPGHRDRGCFRRMLDAALQAELGGLPATAQFYLCYRTRSPFVYRFGRLLCDPMLPAMGAKPEPALEEIAQELAGRLFPDRPVERGTMVMRGIYQHMHYRVEPTCRDAPELNRWFADHVPGPEDSVFCFGECRNRWSRAG